MNEKKFKKLCPFKLQVLESFPFIDADFDALTNYELLCKVVDYLNKTIGNVDYLNKKVEEFQNYFDNLDVQEEINNKLDEMAESGELTDIIAQYLELAGVLAFNTLDDLKNATNLASGSTARTLGTVTYNDGLGNFYKIRTLINTDVIDNDNLVALTNYPTLVAEKIPDARIDSLDDRVTELELTDLVVFGDSWSDTAVTDAIWSPLAAENLNVTLKNYAQNGARMSVALSTQIATYLADTTTSPSKAKYIVILGGLNDYDIENINASTLAGYIRTGINTLKTNCPQAKILYVSNCSYPFTYTQSDYWCDLHNLLSDTGIATYNMDGTLGIELWNTANYRHLTQAGQKFMCGNIVSCLTGGEIKYYRDHRTFTNDNLDFDYSCVRIKDMIFMSAIFNIKTNTLTNLGFSLPSGQQNLPYGSLFNTQGIVGSGFKLGVCDINNQNVVLVFQSAPNITKYFISASYPII